MSYYLGKKSGLAVQIVEKTPNQDAWDYIEPPTPGFSDLSLGIANDAKVLMSYAMIDQTSLRLSVPK